jgi:uncharacterized protein
MFHTILLTAYLVPNIYLFLRIRILFINKSQRPIYTIVYLIVAMIYPFSFLLAGEELGPAGNIIDWISGYLLPFYLYVFLLVLLLDILLLMNLFLKYLPLQKLKSDKYRKMGLPVIIVISMLVVAAGIINFSTIRTSEYRISIPAKSSGLEHLKIVFVADFHLDSKTSIRFVERFAQKIEEIKPDLVIFGGDLVEGDRGDGSLGPFAGLIADIATKYGVYGVLGNHEYYYGQDKGNFYSAAGIRMLADTVEIIDGYFSLAGRKDSHFNGRKSLDEILTMAEDSLPLILVDHRPTEISEVSRSRADIQLSGHTHNGQLFPINFITQRVYPLSWGYRKIGNTNFFVTSGIRLWGPPVRTTGKSEIMIINISFI